jgi:hypothetical protein
MQYDEVSIVCLPGQLDEAGNQRGELSLTAGRNQLKEALARVTSPKTTDVRIVAFSFGCTVALSAVIGQEWGMKRLKVVLCGPIPLWLSWQIFQEGIGRSQMGTSTRMTDDQCFFDDLVPVEHLLPQVDCAIDIVAGADDQYCTQAYMEYLRRYSLEQGLTVGTALINGFRHTPEPGKPGWAEFTNMALA